MNLKYRGSTHINGLMTGFLCFLFLVCASATFAVLSSFTSYFCCIVIIYKVMCFSYFCCIVIITTFAILSSLLLLLYCHHYYFCCIVIITTFAILSSLLLLLYRHHYYFCCIVIIYKVMCFSYFCCIIIIYSYGL